MKNIAIRGFRFEQRIASFGSAQLVDIHGEVYLRGGSSIERGEALEWMSLCMPERPVRLRPMRVRAFRRCRSTFAIGV
jgi:hypothetical protein